MGAAVPPTAVGLYTASAVRLGGVAPVAPFAHRGTRNGKYKGPSPTGITLRGGPVDVSGTGPEVP